MKLHHFYTSMLVVLFAFRLLLASETSDISNENRTYGDHLEGSVSALISHNFDYPILGGRIGLSYKFSKIYSLGLCAGARHEFSGSSQYNSGSVYFPVEIVNTWKIGINNSPCSFPVGITLGFSPAISYFESQDHSSTYVTTNITANIDLGIRAKINKMADILISMQSGIIYDVTYWPRPYIGVQIGPVFSFK